MWKILESEPSSAEENMQKDSFLLESLKPDDAPILHLYDWKEASATYGYFIKPEDFLDLEGVEKEKLTLARRPTGGGIVLHTCDLAFSVLVPSLHEGYSENTLSNYHYINERVILSVKNLLKEVALSLLPQEPVPLDASCQNFCMAKPTIYDVMIEGKKIAGAAQRKRKQGFLHQGTISIGFPKKEFLSAILLPQTKVLEAMQANTYSILGENWETKDLLEIRNILKSHLKRVFNE